MSKGTPVDILIFSHGADEHTLAVLAKLPPHVEALVVDFSKAGSHHVAAFSLGHERYESNLRFVNGADYLISAAQTVWWRRPQPFVQDVARPDVTDYALNEWSSAWGGILQELSCHSLWFNDLNKHRIADRKPYQLTLAQRVGFEVPKTLITSDAIAAQEFLSVNEASIFKAFMGTKENWQPTRLYKPEYADLLHATLAACPVLFQAYVHAEYEVRVIVINDRIFAVAADLRSSRYSFDVRIDTKNARAVFQLPDEICRQLRAFQQLAGLRYGAFDLRIDKHGSYIFLEVNPAGQFLYLDPFFEGQITEAMADALTTPVSQQAPSTLENLSAEALISQPWGYPSTPFSIAVPERISHIK